MNAITIDDLDKPRHTDMALAVIDSLTDITVELSVEAVFADAMGELGEVPCYREPGMEARLALICEAMNEDHNLSTLGRLTNKTMLTRYLVQRSRLEDLYRRHPEIEDQEITAPIIIAGLPRSGTTHLLNLISRDQRLRSLQYWESLEPIPQAGEPVPEDVTQDPRLQRCHESLAMQDQMIPLFKNMHEMTPEHIHEEIELMGMDFSMMLFETYAVIPRWRDYYLAHDQTPHYRFLKRALKALQWLRGPQRWLLKSPQHMEQLPVLHEVFPDATFVLPHRDPISVIASMLTMQSYASRVTRDPVDPHEIGQYWADRLTRMLRQCAQDRDALPAEQTVDLYFGDVTGDVLSAVERIYFTAEQAMTGEVRTAMQNYVDANPRGKHGRILYNLEADFGIDTEELRRELRFYYEKFPVAIE